MRSFENRAVLSVLLLVVLATAVVLETASAAGSTVKVGTAPNIAATNVEVVQGELGMNAGIEISTIKNLTYTYKPHRQCLVAPIGGGCVSYLNVPVDVYLCASSQIGIVYPASKRTVTDLRCTPRLTTLTGSTGAFNGMPINNTNHRFRAYYVFNAPGPTGPFSPHLEGQADSVTVFW